MRLRRRILDRRSKRPTPRAPKPTVGSWGRIPRRRLTAHPSYFDARETHPAEHKYRDRFFACPTQVGRDDDREPHFVARPKDIAGDLLDLGRTDRDRDPGALDGPEDVSRN